MDTTDEDEPNLLLEVAEGYPSDEHRQCIRLPPKKIAALQISTGDVVKLSGDWETYAKAWRADREDWEDNAVKATEYVRVNCQTKIGEKVSVQPVGSLPEVESLTLQPYRGFAAQFTSEAVDQLRRQLERTPSCIGQVHPVLTNSSDVSRKDIPVVVGAQSPGVGLISDSTTVNLSSALLPDSESDSGD